MTCPDCYNLFDEDLYLGECPFCVNRKIDPTPQSNEALTHVDEFFSSIKARIEKGRDTYGDSSFSARAAFDTIEEVQEELLDVCGWSFVLWWRLERMRKAVRT